MEDKWYVSLGDGTGFVELDSLPYVFLATDKQIAKLDKKYGSVVPGPCTDAETEGLINSHIHIHDLVHMSHWDDDPQNHTGHKNVVDNDITK